MWEGMLCNKQSLDLLQKLMLIFQGIINCAGEHVTIEEMQQIAAQIMPLVGK